MAPLWDSFVDRCRQGCFLFRRGFMDYHADRFEDCSLVAYDGGRAVALLPASIAGVRVSSHGGLTFGGWLTDMSRPQAADLLTLTGMAVEFYKSLGVSELLYKPVPWIYPSIPADDDRYAMFRLGASPEACSLSSAIDCRLVSDGFSDDTEDDIANMLAHKLFDANACRNRAKALRSGVTISRSDDFKGYWELLTEVLTARHGVRPVHSVGEIELLRGRFPDNIRLYTAQDADGQILAGTVIFRSRHVAHAQYIASSSAGRQAGALPALFAQVIAREAYGMRYFDFGISCEQGGRILNQGLLRQKEGFGGRSVAYESYLLKF